MHTFPVLNVGACMEIADVSEFDTDIVSCDYRRGKISSDEVAESVPLLIRILPSSTASSLITIRTARPLVTAHSCRRIKANLYRVFFCHYEAIVRHQLYLSRK
jgi:hypothetical protein